MRKDVLKSAFGREPSPAELDEIARIVGSALHKGPSSVTYDEVSDITSYMDGVELLKFASHVKALAAEREERELEQAGQVPRVPQDSRPLVLTVQAGGALVAQHFIEDESARARQVERTAAARSQARLDQVAEDAEILREHEAAEADVWRERFPAA